MKRSDAMTRYLQMEKAVLILDACGPHTAADVVRDCMDNVWNYELDAWERGWLNSRGAARRAAWAMAAGVLLLWALLVFAAIALRASALGALPVAPAPCDRICPAGYPARVEGRCMCVEKA